MLYPPPASKIEQNKSEGVAEERHGTLKTQTACRLGFAPRLKKGEVWDAETGMPVKMPPRPGGDVGGNNTEGGGRPQGYAGPTAPTRLGLLMRNDEMG